MKRHVILYSIFLIFISSLLYSCDNKEMEKVILDNEDPVVTVNNVSPLTGYVSTEITITGTEFGMMADAVTVYMGETELEIVSCEENKIVARIPKGATSGKISVDVFGQRVDTEFLFDVLGEPGITGVNPVYGFVGDEITFIGHDLGVSKSNYNILFEGTEKTAEISGAPENEKFIVKIPENANSGKIKIEIAGKNVNVPLTNGFTVLQHATVTGLVSNEGYAGGNIEISGTNLSPELLEEVTDLKPVKVVLSNGENEFTLENISDKTTNEKIVAKLPEEIAAGQYKVNVSTSFENVSVDLTYTVKEKPVFQSISKSEAHVGTEIDITCSNIEGVEADNVEIMFGETKGDVVSVSESVIKVKVPQLDAGSYTLKLSINGAKIDLGGSTQFEVLKTPKIISVNIDNLLHNETTALVTAETVLVIEGEGFGTSSEGVTLTIGGQNAIITSIEDTKIEFTVPETFSNGNISIEFSGIETLVVYNDVTFKLLTNGTDITEYVMKNYGPTFTYQGQLYNNEWAYPQDWEVDGNIFTDRETGNVGYQIKEGVTSLTLQTGWKVDSSNNGKIYQKVVLIPGSYKLTAEVADIVKASGSAYLAVCIDKDFTNVDTGNIEGSSSARTEITAKGDVSVDFTIDSKKEISLGFVASIKANSYVKVQSFKLTYEGTSSN